MTGASSPDLRVGLFGNVANALFHAAQALRSEPGVEPHLFVNRTDSPFARPESVDPALASGYPPWIHEGDWITPRSVLAPWRAEITRELAQCDVLMVSGPGPLYAQFAGKPWGWLVTGGDLTVKPFPLSFLSWYDGLVHKSGELVGGTWQRRAARRADRLWVQPFAPMRDALARLRVPTRAISDIYLPMVVETDRFSVDRPLAATSSDAARSMLASDLAVFHPSRLVFRADQRLRRTGQWKGNDILIEGFARMVGRGHFERPLLVMPDIGLSRDVASAKALIRDLGIEDNVVWARPASGQAFPQHELIELYQASDVVATDFGAGWFGYATLEGLASGKPVVSHIDGPAMLQLYPDGHPICEAASPDEVCAQLERLGADPAARHAIGEESRAWVEAHHSPGAVGPRYRAAVEELASLSGLPGS